MELEKFTNFFKFVAFVGKEWCFATCLNTTYFSTKVSVIVTESSIYKKFLKKFDFKSQNMINNDQIVLLYFCDDIKSHRSGGDSVP